MHDRRRSLLVQLFVVVALMAFAAPAQAGKQATVSNPPAALRPGKTSSVHEIGLSLNGTYSPNAFIPAFNWRFHLPKTGRLGQLSGLYMGFNAGPGVSFYGGRHVHNHAHDFSYRDVWGRVGFELGYEFDPWSNLAVTVSPVIHNDLHFSPRFVQFAQTFGLAFRVYINQHWVFYVEPGLAGWNLWTDLNHGHDHSHLRADFTVRGGLGFAYKF